MYSKTYQFQLTGITPLIMHWDNLDGQDELEAWRRSQPTSKKSKDDKKGDDRSPPHTWKMYVYGDGTHIAMPHDNIRRCMVQAGAKVILTGRTTHKALCASAIMLDMYYPLLINGKSVSIADIDAIDGTYPEHKAAVEKLGFSLFAKRAAVGASKHVRVRPFFSTWAIVGTMNVIDERIDGNTLGAIMQIAGLEIGLGDWRPSAPKSPGPYGKFSADVSEAK